MEQDDAAGLGTPDADDVLRIDLGLGEGGGRLDARLARALADRPDAPSRSRVKALIEGGHLEVNGAVERQPSRKLRGGETLRLTLPPPAPAAPEPTDIPLAFLHEDEHVAVVVKPAGMVTHPGAGVREGTLVNALLHHLGDRLSGIGGVVRPGIVHRLDRDTSGVMIVAKTDRAHRALSAQFADHGRTTAMDRRYRALVWGRPVPSAGTISAALGRDVRDRTRRAVSGRPDARPAVTHYATLEPFERATLLECRLETGRTHQIRVHMAHAGHPLLGDATYGAGMRSREATLPEQARAALASMPGQALHAHSLTFEHPSTGEVMRFEAPLPPPFQKLVTALGRGT